MDTERGVLQDKYYVGDVDHGRTIVIASLRMRRDCTFHEKEQNCNCRISKGLISSGQRNI